MKIGRSAVRLATTSRKKRTSGSSTVISSIRHNHSRWLTTTVSISISITSSLAYLVQGSFIPTATIIGQKALFRPTAPTTCSRTFTTTSMQMSFSDTTTTSSSVLKFVDIGANLLDDRFTQGIYHDQKRHEPDWECVMERAAKMGVQHIVLTAGTVQESAQAVQQVRQLRDQSSTIKFSCTVGVHPTRCQQEFIDHATPTHTDEDILQDLLQIAQDGMKDHSVVAIGEIGLDYDRLQFTPKDVQTKYLIRQLQVVAAATGLPLFLHNRSVGRDLYHILSEHQDCWKKRGGGGGGVVHSFDDSLELATQFIQELGLYIGLNGCSLRTEDNLKVVQQLPLDRILLETDCPYCEVKRTHAGYHHLKTMFATKPEKKFERGTMVKGRCEPCQIIQVAEVVAGAKNLPLQQVADACYRNSLQLYGWQE